MQGQKRYEQKIRPLLHLLTRLRCKRNWYARLLFLSDVLRQSLVSSPRRNQLKASLEVVAVASAQDRWEEGPALAKANWVDRRAVVDSDRALWDLGPQDRFWTVCIPDCHPPIDCDFRMGLSLNFWS